MGEHAFIGMIAQQSVPIQRTAPLFNNADYKKQQALTKLNTITQGIYESVESYQKRMAEFRANLAKQQVDSNTQAAEKRLKEITNMSLWNTSDPYKLKQGQDKLGSFFRFTQFNNIDTSKINTYMTKKLEHQTSERLAKIEQGKDSGNNNNPIYLASEFQDLGERDFLA